MKIDEMQMLDSRKVKEILCCSMETARNIMAEMPGCVDIGTGKTRSLRVPVSGLEAYLSNNVIAIRPASNRIARRRGGKLQAV